MHKDLCAVTPLHLAFPCCFSLPMYIFFIINCTCCLCFFVFSPVDSGSGVEVDAVEERAAAEGDKGAIEALHANNIASLALRTPGRVLHCVLYSNLIWKQ